jgi:hypothetical protein
MMEEQKTMFKRSAQYVLIGLLCLLFAQPARADTTGPDAARFELVAIVKVGDTISELTHPYVNGLGNEWKEWYVEVWHDGKRLSKTYYRNVPLGAEVYIAKEYIRTYEYRVPEGSTWRNLAEQFQITGRKPRVRPEKKIARLNGDRRGRFTDPLTRASIRIPNEWTLKVPANPFAGVSASAEPSQVLPLSRPALEEGWWSRFPTPSPALLYLLAPVVVIGGAVLLRRRINNKRLRQKRDLWLGERERKLEQIAHQFLLKLRGFNQGIDLATDQYEYTVCPAEGSIVFSFSNIHTSLLLSYIHTHNIKNEYEHIGAAISDRTFPSVDDKCEVTLSFSDVDKYKGPRWQANFMFLSLFGQRFEREFEAPYTRAKHKKIGFGERKISVDNQSISIFAWPTNGTDYPRAGPQLEEDVRQTLAQMGDPRFTLGPVTQNGHVVEICLNYTKELKANDDPRNDTTANPGVTLVNGQ